MKISYSQHALANLADRDIDPAWVERTVYQPKSLEPDPKHPERLRAFRAVPERDGRILRVVYVPSEGVAHIVTMFLDRGRRRPS